MMPINLCVTSLRRLLPLSLSVAAPPPLYVERRRVESIVLLIPEPRDRAVSEV